MKYPIRAYFQGLVPFNHKQVNAAPWCEIDLFKSVLRFRCPKQTYFPSDDIAQIWQDYRPFVDTLTQADFKGFRTGGPGIAVLLDTGWEFKPSVWSNEGCIVLKMSVNVFTLSTADRKAGREFNDADELIKWVNAYSQGRADFFAQWNFIQHDDGMLSFGLNEPLDNNNKSLKNALSEQANAAQNAPTTHQMGNAQIKYINDRQWVIIKVATEIYFYTIIAKEDVLCFRFKLDKGEITPQQGSPSHDKLNKIERYIESILASVDLTPSNRLSGYLKDKGIM